MMKTIYQTKSDVVKKKKQNYNISFFPYVVDIIGIIQYKVEETFVNEIKEQRWILSEFFAKRCLFKLVNSFKK